MGGTVSAQRVETGFLDRVVQHEGHEFSYQVYVPRDYTPTARWPVILFLHGAGERGSSGLLQTDVGLAAAIRRNPDRYPAIAVMPQVPLDSLWTGVPAEAAMAALRQTMAEFSADSSRIYLTGLSMGGNGTWYLAYRYADQFAAVVPICGWVSARSPLRGGLQAVPADAGEPFAALAQRLVGVPVWIFHGEVDPVVPVDESRRAAAALEAAGVDVRYTELLGIGHNSWDPAYGSVEFSSWLFAQRRP
jgi:predicted peptidase